LHRIRDTGFVSGLCDAYDWKLGRNLITHGDDALRDPPMRSLR